MFTLSLDLFSITTVEKCMEKFDIESLLTYRDITIVINIPTTMVKPEILLVILGYIKYLESKGININKKINNANNNTYISRIDFYKQISVTYDEQFNRHDSSGKFKEITNFNEDNSVSLTNEIIKIIKYNCDIDESVLDCLNYCLFEIMDNVQNHSECKEGGYVVAQSFPNCGEITLGIMDFGIGIHKSLIKSSKYKNKNEIEALNECIKKGATNGLSGKGNGLYHTSNFIKENKGMMNIYSGYNVLKCNNMRTEIIGTNYWQGTLIIIKIKTNNSVSLESIFDGDIPITVTESNECINSLW